MKRFFTQIIGNITGLYLITHLMEGVRFSGSITELIIVGFIFGIINFTIKPLIKFFSIPFIILSLGLFLIIINMAMLKILTILTPSLAIANLFTLFWATIILSTVNFIVENIFKINS